MSDKQFDKDLKNLFEDHRVSYDPDSWSMFEHKLEEVKLAEQHDDEIDSHIQEKLQNHKVPYKSSHWSLLLKKLELQDKLERNIYITKIIEAAIVLLLVISYFHIQPLEQIRHSSKNQETAAIDTHNALSDETLIDQQYVSEEIDQVNPILQEIPVLESSLNTEDNNHAIIELKSNVVASEKPVQAILSTTGLIRSNRLAALIQPLSRQHSFIISGESLNHNMINDQLTSAFLASLNATNISGDNSRSEVEEVKALALVSASLHSVTEKLQTIPQHIIATNKGRLGFYSSADINIVNRPLDLNFFQQPQQYGAFGTSFGITYSKKNGRNEIETAIAYSKKSYDPNLLEKITVNSSFYDREFTNQSFRILQLPFHYKRHLVDNSSWSLYAVAGAQANFVGYTDYEFENTLKSGQPRPNSAIENNSKLKRSKDFHQGILQGGSFVKNSYLTANIGFGIEKYIGKYSLYVQPMFNQHLFEQTLGPNNERLNVISLQLGTKIKL